MILENSLGITDQIELSITVNLVTENERHYRVTPGLLSAVKDVDSAPPQPQRQRQEKKKRLR